MPWAPLQVASSANAGTPNQSNNAPTLMIWDECTPYPRKNVGNHHATLAERQTDRFDCDPGKVGRAWVGAALSQKWYSVRTSRSW